MSEKIITDKIRREYTKDQLSEEDVLENPFDQFRKWLTEAINSSVELPNAMVLATATKDGHPDARVVLLKELTEQGLTFFTNYQSPKGEQLSKNQNAACVFYWSEADRQIRIKGKTEKVDDKISDTYFHSRPKDSQIASLVSNQSKVVKSRDELEQRFDKVKKDFGDTQIPRPAHWGGYLLVPESFEFWQGRQNRFHDRIFFDKEANGNWSMKRLAP